jgi:hypothetical protein
MTSLGLAITLFLSLVVLISSRTMAALAVMAGVCYITQGQEYDFGGFHFTAIRLILLAGFFRTLFRRELQGIRTNKIDWALIGFILITNLIPTLRENTHKELVYRLGMMYDMVLPYWIFRALLSNWDEAEKFLHGMSLLIIPLALEMLFETFSGRNLFESFGGIGELTIRKGRPRCQGAFLIGITAGIFGATLMPLFLGFVLIGKKRIQMIIGLVATVIITYTSNSSGPLMAFFCGIVGWLFWPLRHNMKKVRWGIVVSLIVLQCCMTAPVYYIFSRLSDITGGDGWHRSYLIDQTIHHFSGWWVMGTSDTGDWMATKLSNGKADITNQYVAAALNGGLTGFFLLILLLIRCFRGLGLAIKEIRNQSPDMEWVLWGMGAALFAHVVTFFDVSYWDQLGVVWFAFLAMISGSTADILKRAPAIRPAEDIAGFSSGEVGTA